MQLGAADSGYLYMEAKRCFVQRGFWTQKSKICARAVDGMDIDENEIRPQSGPARFAPVGFQFVLASEAQEASGLFVGKETVRQIRSYKKDFIF